jgi:diacylglycerol kinase family enzyme
MSACVQILFNPEAGTYSARRIERLRKALEKAGATTILFESSSKSKAIMDPRATHLCVAGGDGTLRHAIAALRAASSAIPVAQYPAGTINLVAREAEYPRNPTKFAKRLLASANLRTHYTASFNDETFLTCASIGPECRAISNLSAGLKRRLGRSAYAVAFIQSLFHWRRAKLRVQIDGHEYSCEAVYIAKGRYFAGPWSFAPAATLTDDLLHVIMLETARRRDFFTFVLDVMRGCRPEKRRGVAALTCRHLAINGGAGEEAQADGDIIGTLPAEIRSSATPIPFT